MECSVKVYYYPVKIDGDDRLGVTWNGVLSGSAQARLALYYTHLEGIVSRRGRSKNIYSKTKTCFASSERVLNQDRCRRLSLQLLHLIQTFFRSPSRPIRHCWNATAAPYVLSTVLYSPTLQARRPFLSEQKSFPQLLGTVLNTLFFSYWKKNFLNRHTFFYDIVMSYLFTGRALYT